MGQQSKNYGGWGIFALVLVGAYALANVDGDTQATETPDAFGFANTEEASDEPDRDLLDSTVTVSGTKGGSTYEQFDEERDATSVDSYAGYGCLTDCSGHSAGYEWAQKKGISDPDDCGGNSWSFVEGCTAYAEEQAGEPTEDEPADDEPDLDRS